MKAVVTVQGGKTAVQEIPSPKPAKGEILVRVHYAAQNPTDWKGAAYHPPGRIIGCDFAGTVEDPNGSSWRQGQRVAGFVYGGMNEPLRGSFAEYLVTEPSLVWAVPDSVSLRDASTLSLAFATAVQAMFQRLGLSLSTSPFPILINGGASSVGMYAIQLAKLAGMRVIATGSTQNHELLKSYGADEVIDYTNAAWPDKVRDLTQDGLEYAFDCVGDIEATKAVAKAMSSTRGGRIICILPRKSEELPAELSKVKIESTIVYTAFGYAIDVTGSGFQNWGGPTPRDREFWEMYLRLLPGLIESGKIRPNPSKELHGLEAVQEGFHEQIAGKIRAQKIVYKLV